MLNTNANAPISRDRKDELVALLHDAVKAAVVQACGDAGVERGERWFTAGCTEEMVGALYAAEPRP